MYGGTAVYNEPGALDKNSQRFKKRLTLMRKGILCLTMVDPENWTTH